jgi:hypothetical protein
MVHSSGVVRSRALEQDASSVASNIHQGLHKKRDGPLNRMQIEVAQISEPTGSAIRW